MKLTTGDISEVTGLSVKLINDWREKRILVPAEGGSHQGDHCKYTIMQTVGIAVGAKLRRSARGCALPYVASVVEGFGDLTEETLLKRFAKGATHLMTVVGPRSTVVLDGPIYGDMIDVQRIYQEVTLKITELSREPANAVGRNRGLVS